MIGSSYQLRYKLIAVFVTATLVPLIAILWVSAALLDRSLSYAVTNDLDRLSKSLEEIAREYYRQARENLREEVASGRLEPQYLDAAAMTSGPASWRQFWESSDPERFVLSEPDGDRLHYLVRQESLVLLYSKSLNGVRMENVTRQYREARAQVERTQALDLRRGFTYTLILLSAVIWALSLACVVYLANRISRPIQDLTGGLLQLASGNFATRLHLRRQDEVGRAVQAFNNTAEQLEQSRNRLVYLTQIASWQQLARKMAHELKNSLTPIRLTIEEVLARQPAPDRPFLEQAARVMVDEVESLERRVRAFSDFATEPPSHPAALDLQALMEERIQFLQVGHPDIRYEIRHMSATPAAWADVDQVKGILTNLLENGAEAAGPGGKVLSITGSGTGKIYVEVHDSGPGLNEAARRSLFEPSISFKPKGMGLGLSISRKNALMAGGDLVAIEGQLGGAGFRLVLPAETQAEGT